MVNWILKGIKVSYSYNNWNKKNIKGIIMSLNGVKTGQSLISFSYTFFLFTFNFLYLFFPSFPFLFVILLDILPANNLFFKDISI